MVMSRVDKHVVDGTDQQAEHRPASPRCRPIHRLLMSMKVPFSSTSFAQRIRRTHSVNLHLGAVTGQVTDT